MDYIFSIAGMRYLVTIEKEIEILERHLPFFAPMCRENEKEINGRIVFEEIPVLPAVPEDAILEQYRYYSPSEDDKTWFLYSMERPVYAYSDRRNAPGEIRIFLSPEGSQQIENTNVLMILMETETLLCQNGGLMMHGCIVKADQGGIMFTGPSGVGKSTQGKLWESYEGAEILNGDRSGLVKMDGEWHAWGLPFSGSSCIYINRSTPLKAIVLLEQGKENEIRRLSLREAMAGLYPQTHMHNWSRSYMEKGTGTLTELLFSVPVYKLRCRPDQEAVELVKKTVFPAR